MKKFIIQSLNFYFPFFYIAFLQGNFYGYPGHYNTIAGYRHETVLELHFTLSPPFVDENYLYAERKNESGGSIKTR